MSVWAKVVDRYLHYQPRSSERVKTVAPIPFTEILNAARILSTLPSLQLNLLNGILKPFFNLVLSWHCIFWVFKEVVCFFFFISRPSQLPFTFPVYSTLVFLNSQIERHLQTKKHSNWASDSSSHRRKGFTAVHPNWYRTPFSCKCISVLVNNMNIFSAMYLLCCFWNWQHKADRHR